jgi:hypothetical protein
MHPSTAGQQRANNDHLRRHEYILSLSKGHHNGSTTKKAAQL